jgi:hypothetical protein
LTEENGMNEPVHISPLMLERYHVGDITDDEKQSIESALKEKPGLGDSWAKALADLDRSDGEIRGRYPGSLMLRQIEARARRSRGRSRLGGPGHSPLIWGLCAAALVLAIALPVLWGSGALGRARGGLPPEDRVKGAESPAPAELSVYLKTDSRDIKLAERSVLRAGNTIQLAYSVNAEPLGSPVGLGRSGARSSNPALKAFPRERYGVIFSIDGRSAVTLHFPYAPGQSTRLIAGKQVPLDEAYTLDDAPDFEIFFFIVNDEALDARAILASAEQLARNPALAMERCDAVFWDYEVKTLILRKE